ncbi:glycosyltransferase, partial [Arthrospira platensis SPKY1]|nr:glycosyltransferase [Arthrospira platensis SPKY1]
MDRYQSGDLLFFGRLEHDKGVDTLIKAYHQSALAQQRRLRIFGDGDTRASLQQLVRDLGLQHLVYFEGWVDQAQLADALH